VIAEESVTTEWQGKVSDWLVKSGCKYMMAWGMNCSSWDDSVDYALLEKFNFGDIPDDNFVMTTWHENEPLKEAFGYVKNTAIHQTIEIENTFLLHISLECKEQEYLDEFSKA
jgi:hypothetical protein